MVTLNLDRKEQEVLEQLMQHALATLEIEIRHADHAEFKKLLKDRREVFNNLLEKIEHLGPVLA